ncbi:unnamed protein product [Mytilus coruscus]|uniref:CSMD n=1 Tax=Mytilus coruscus TaxID=42192 RepID=A0A6J8ES52_MYTCO|nr:unnamed protein product [Mytilus coruscus]
MYSSMSDASCALPADMKNTVWEYNYTDVSGNSEHSTNLNIATTTLQNSVINLNAFGTTIRDWTCINSLDVSDTTTVVVFKSDTSFTSGPSSGNRRLYLCMKLTKVTTDLYYFHLLSDIETSIFPYERVFISEENNAPRDDAPMCSTFCQYTDSPNIRTLRRQGTNDVLPNDASLCEPCESACDMNDICNPNPCQNNGTSIDLTDSFNCTCAPGWEDDNCTTVMTCDYPDTVPHTTNVTSGNELDDSITFSCAVGYENISGDTLITCRSDAQVKCPNPSFVTFAVISSQTGSHYLDKITYTCDTGYERIGGNLVRTCKEDKQWNGTPPVCSVKNTVTKILRQYSRLITVGGLIICGLLVVVIAFCCLLKGRSKDTYMDTSTIDVILQNKTWDLEDAHQTATNENKRRKDLNAHLSKCLKDKFRVTVMV